MAKRFFGFFILLIFITFSPSFAEETFKDFKQQQANEKKDFKGEYSDYKKTIEEEYADYVTISKEEMGKLLDAVKKSWGDGIVTTNKIWVQYSPDMSLRSIVNYENGKITIETINEPEKVTKDYMIGELAKLLTENLEDAFKSDMVAQNIEMRLLKDFDDVKSSSLPKQSMIGDLVGVKGILSEKDALKKSAELLSASSLAVVKLSNGRRAARISFSTFVELAEPAKPIVNDNNNSDTIKVSLAANKFVGSIHKKADAFSKDVKEFANARKIPEALVYAIIHNESSFNPLATSYVPAYGMMQLVAASGGKEASVVVFGKPVILAPSYFYDPRKNIQLGAIYLSQLYYNYFKDIKNFEARLYCTICAYNTGAGNVAKAIVGDRNLKKAIETINSMDVSELYNKLLKDLPYDETKSYLRKVSASYNAYSHY